MDMIGLLCCRSWRQQPNRHATEFWQRDGDEQQGRTGLGVCVSLCCIARLNINKRSCGGQTATNAASPRLHPPGDPALIASWFGRVTFLLCGQLHLQHAHLKAQDDGGVGVAAEWRLVLTWRTKDRGSVTMPGTAAGWPYSTVNPSKTHPKDLFPRQGGDRWHHECNSWR